MIELTALKKVWKAIVRLGNLETISDYGEGRLSAYRYSFSHIQSDLRAIVAELKASLYPRERLKDGTVTEWGVDSRIIDLISAIDSALKVEEK